jgi:nucleotide-binding universal stress UspA family protein
MYHSLLVPLDGSAYAEQALPAAFGIARRAGAAVQLATVATQRRVTPLLSAQSSSHLADRWRDYLQRVVERARQEYGVSVSSVVLDGADVATALRAHAKDAAADLVVMSTHGRGFLGRLWFGSVAYELMHRLPIPMLFIRPDDGVGTWGQEPALRHLLVTLDGSSPAEKILEPAAAFGTLMDADFTLMRVINDIPLGTPEFDSISLSSAAVGVLDEIQTVERRLRNEAQQYLDGVAERLRARGLKVATRVAAAGDPGKAILEAVATGAYDLVALQLHALE